MLRDATAKNAQSEKSRKDKSQSAGPVMVCKTMFLSTLDISESWVRTCLKKLGEGHTISPDKRGKHSKVNPELQKKNEENIMEHIRLFKPVPSHFCRANVTRKYLDRFLTIRHMWRMYKSWMAVAKPQDQIKPEKFYRKIFCTKFNLGFHRPKKDQCDQCVVYDIATPAQKEKMKAKYDIHIENKMKAKEAKKADKVYGKANRDTVCFAIYDLQKVFSLPKLDVGLVFYKRKWSVYNFTIYDAVKKQGYCYMWDETEGKKGANEIGSSVLLFIAMKAKEGFKEIIFWSDNCSGQNKNKFLFLMYMYACAKYGIKIIHRYMEKGHTMNEADSMHATIERAARYEKIYDPSDLVPIIKKSKKKGKPYEVHLLKDDILDFHDFAERRQNWKHRQAKWKQVREVMIEPDKPGSVFLKHDFAQKDYVEIKVNCVGRPVNLANHTFKKAFDKPIALCQKKLKDFATLCNEMVIPSYKQASYRNLVNFPDLRNPLLVEEDEQEVDDVDDVSGNPDFMWDYENDEDSDTDYEEELRVIRATQEVHNAGNVDADRESGAETDDDASVSESEYGESNDDDSSSGDDG